MYILIKKIIIIIKQSLRSLYFKNGVNNLEALFIKYDKTKNIEYLFSYLCTIRKN